MSCPSAVPGDKDLLGLINKDNNLTQTSEDLNFNAPEVLAEGESNTKVKVDASATNTHSGSVEVEYDRLDLETLFQADMIQIVVSGDPSLEDMLCGINADYGTTFDATDFTMSQMSEDVVHLEAKPESLAYIGSINVQYILDRMHLDSRLTTSNLDGFGYPNADVASPNNIIVKDEPIQSGIKRFTASNGRLLITSRDTSGGAINYPTSVLNHTDVVSVRAAVVGANRQFPSSQWRFSLLNPDGSLRNATFAEIVEDYDIELRLSGRNAIAPTVLKPVLNEAGTSFTWLAPGLTGGTGNTSVGASGEFSTSFNWASASNSRASIYGVMLDHGMTNTGSGDSEGTVGLLISELVVKPKKYAGKELRSVMKTYR